MSRYQGTADGVLLVEADRPPGVNVASAVARAAALVAPFDGPRGWREWEAYHEGRGHGFAAGYDEGRQIGAGVVEDECRFAVLDHMRRHPEGIEP